MSSDLDAVLASIDQVGALSPDDFHRVIEHWKRRAAILWAGPALPMRGPAPPMQGNAPPTPATENNEPVAALMNPLHIPPGLPVPMMQQQTAKKRRQKSTASARPSNVNINGGGSDPSTPSTIGPSTWTTTARKRLDSKMLSLKDSTVPPPSSTTLVLAIEKLRYFIIRALHPNLHSAEKGGDNCLGLSLGPRVNFNYDGYFHWIESSQQEGDEATRRLAQVWFFYKMADILTMFCDDEKRRGEGGNEQGRLQRGYDKLLPICKRILDTDNRQYIRNLICSSRRFRQLCVHMVGADRAEIFVFFKGELTLTDLKDMTASAAKMEETTAMLDVVLDDYLTTVSNIEVPIGGELTGIKIDMWNGLLQLS